MPRVLTTALLLVSLTCRHRPPWVPLPPVSPVPRSPPGGVEAVLRPARTRCQGVVGLVARGASDGRGCGFLPEQADGVVYALLGR